MNNNKHFKYNQFGRFEEPVKEEPKINYLAIFLFFFGVTLTIYFLIQIVNSWFPVN